MGLAALKEIRLGLDVGSVYAKLIALLPSELFAGIGDELRASSVIEKFESSAGYHLVAFKPKKVLGNPQSVAQESLNELSTIIPSSNLPLLQITGSQGKLVAELLEVPYVNEFKAICRGVVEQIPDARIILEIGGDGSKYMRVSFNPVTEELSILDYQRNGDCAAGTGSFIDQQAARLRFEVEDIGPFVLQADATANIAGRCSVFAKSDMVHAQQRGYSPATIFKGLCEAVVRNYKGTILRNKALEPKIVFIGGVAANHGVVEAMRSTLCLDADEMIVPELHNYFAALGCALLPGGEGLRMESLLHLQNHDVALQHRSSVAQKLDLSMVRILDDVRLTSSTGLRSYPLDAYLGIDIGSVSTNLVLLDKAGQVLDEIYTRTDGRPVEVVQTELARWKDEWANKVNVIGVGTTGSGRELIGELVGADVIYDEITAHKTGSGFIAKMLFNEQVETIFEIGGQDSKFISLEDDVVVDFTMNEACAAGTGSFLEEQAAKLGISIENDFARLALSSDNPVQMGERCTVFMEKDVAAYLKQGVPKEDITAGLAFAVVQNYLNRVVRGRKIGKVIYFQGGTAYNKAVAAAFATTLGKQIVVPPHNGVMGAIGAALLAMEKMRHVHSPSRFRGFDLSQVDFGMRHIACKACSNQCDVQECTVEGEKTYWGDKCSERFRKKRKVPQQSVIPDLIGLYQDLLLQDTPAPDGLGIRIGIPRTMYFYDRFPFWRAYFSALGAEIVLSSPTQRPLIAKGRELCIAEPCFPIIAAHGHVLDLFEQKVDYVFIPNAINAETENLSTESWYCPWGQTLPLVLKNTLLNRRQREQILAPVIRFRDGKEAVKDALLPMAKHLGVSRKANNEAIDLAYAIQQNFKARIKETGQQALFDLAANDQSGIVLLGRPYNIYDSGLNLSVPGKLRRQYGINVIPMDFLPADDLDISSIHENMFWNYGRRILQAAGFVGRNRNLHVIYFTNFKCGPDSYIKHFVREATGAPFLTLQFDDHSNDAGVMTRCEAYLESKGLLGSGMRGIDSGIETSVQRLKCLEPFCFLP